MLCVKNVYVVFTGALEYFPDTPLREPADSPPLFFNYSLEFARIPEYITVNLSMRCFKGNPEYFAGIQSKHYFIIFASRNYFHGSFMQHLKKE